MLKIEKTSKNIKQVQILKKSKRRVSNYHGCKIHLQKHRRKTRSKNALDECS